PSRPSSRRRPVAVRTRRLCAPAASGSTSASTSPKLAVRSVMGGGKLLPDGESARPRRLYLEPRTAVSRLGQRDRDVVLPLSLVRRSQGAPQRLRGMAEIPLERAATAASPPAAGASTSAEPRAARAAG